MRVLNKLIPHKIMYKEKYSQWIESPYIDKETVEELKNIIDEKEIEDRFYRDLEFGTGGLRGVIGAGSNRMNVYTVGKATQGFAEYLNNRYKAHSEIEKAPISVAIAYDSRNMSKEFALHSALVLCANNIKVYLYEGLRPTPVLSFTVRELNCKGGIVITASHNPKQYNGYKVYGEDGGQVTDSAASEILSYIEAIEGFEGIKLIDKSVAEKEGLLNIIGEDVDKIYIEKVKALSIRKDMIKNEADKLKIIYTPIHGSGNVPVRRVLSELGYSNLTVVKEQELPDGNFPTAAYPNPEDPAVFQIALKMVQDIQPDIIFGTDPDCDRIGIVVKDSEGQYKVLSGNQTGMLLTYYMLNSLRDKGQLSSKGTIIKTIVTTEMIRKITSEYGVQLIDVLTGFKYIGEKIKEFEQSQSNEYLFGFEESYGYLAGTFVRDKDAVIASMLICEMALYYKQSSKSLYDALIELYEKYGYYKEGLVSIELEGKEGQEKIATALEYLRKSTPENVEKVKIIKSFDYRLSIEKDIILGEESHIDLPKSNVLKFILEDGSWFVVRPSGTEPKMKIYLSVVGSSLQDSESKLAKFKKSVMSIVNSACEN